MVDSGAAILVVDDEPLLRRLYQRLLVPAGYAIVVTDSTREAIEILTRGQPPIWMAITDWQLGDVTAADLIDHCGDQHPDLPVVCVSGSIAQGEVSVPLLTKPVSPDALFSMIKAYAARRQA